MWLINLDPAIGAEIRKTCPAVIFKDDSIGILHLRPTGAPIRPPRSRQRRKRLMTSDPLPMMESNIAQRLTHHRIESKIVMSAHKQVPLLTLIAGYGARLNKMQCRRNCYVGVSFMVHAILSSSFERGCSLFYNPGVILVSYRNA
ncbi:MAG: hypothetical protein AB9866_18315 [Syntrophobacteraceae bacterium]